MLCGVPTQRLNEQVQRNSDRFPGDFMFQLTDNEKAELLSLQHETFAGNTRAQLKQVFEALRQLMAPPAELPKRPIGFVTREEKKARGKG